MNWFKRHLVNSGVNGALGKVTNNHKTTILGAILAALQMSGVDWVKLSQGDLGEAGKAGAAAITALLGWLINKPEKTQ